eukprot:GHVO01037321.1.p1 GENE.GHVO01037321.1~~GHVO01037321.1.p1  ORF type:complete len:535 (+),score=96.38 GHVO01037321.1:22-1605(+)
MGATQDKHSTRSSEVEENGSSFNGDAWSDEVGETDKECGCHTEVENGEGLVNGDDDDDTTEDIKEIVRSEDVPEVGNSDIDFNDGTNSDMGSGPAVTDSGICELKESLIHHESESSGAGNDDIDSESSSESLGDFSNHSPVEDAPDNDCVQPCVEIEVIQPQRERPVKRDVPLKEIRTRSDVTSSKVEGQEHSEVLMLRLTEEKQRRRSAEEWTEIFEVELEAHIKARMEAEQQCAEMKKKYKRLLKKYKGLRSGKEHGDAEEMHSEEEVNGCHHAPEKPFASLGALKEHWSEKKKKNGSIIQHNDEEPLDDLLGENEVRRQPVRVKIQNTPPTSPDPPRTSTPVSQRSPRTSEHSELSAVLDGSKEDSISNVSKTRQAWETLFTSGVKASPNTSPLLSRKAEPEDCPIVNGGIHSAKELWEEKVYHGSNSNLRVSENGSMITEDPDVVREYQETSTTEAVLADSISNINETRALWETKLAQEEEEAAAMRVQNPVSRRSSKILRLQNHRQSASIVSDEHDDEEGHA